MDAVQSGQSFTVTRDGHRVGEPIPLRRHRHFVPRDEFAAMSRTAPAPSWTPSAQTRTPPSRNRTTPTVDASM